jgi:shikimate kinase
MTPKLVIVGPPGAGKTTIGQSVAARLGVAFRDTDIDIENAAGKPISEIFIDDGEEHFRALERAAIVTALGEHDGVLALGGGAVLDPETRKDLIGQTVAYLEVDVPDAVRRIGLNRDRPLLIGNPRQQLRALLDQRRPLYVEVATFVIDASEDVDTVTADIVGRLS